MFSAYLDESGKGVERKSFLAVGGLVSSALQWGRLQSEWTDHLLRVPKMPLDEGGRPVPFHMTDFESGNWPTTSYQWPSAKAQIRFLHGLIDIMRYRIKLRVFTVIYLKHYHLMFSRDKRHKIPWVMCALGCASRISKWGEQKATDPIPFIFERGGEGWGRALENLDSLKNSGRLGKTKIGNWSLDDKHIAGLQAADLWAWELRHHFQAQLPELAPYELRTSLEKLMYGIPDGAGFVIGGADLQVLMEDLRLGTSTIKPVTFAPEGFPKLEVEAL